MKWNLTSRIMVPSAVLIAAITATIGVISYTQSRTTLAKTLDTQLADTCNSTVTSVESWVNAQSTIVRLWGNDPDFRTALAAEPGSPARTKASEALARAIKILDGAENLCLIGPDGIAIASANPALIGKLDVHERTYFLSSMAGKPAVSDVLTSRDTGNPIVCVSAPVMDGAKPVGVVFIAVDLRAFSERVVTPIKALDTGYAFMFDQTGLLLAHPNKSHIMKTRIGEFDWGKTVLAEKNGQMTYEFEGQAKSLVFRTSKTLPWGIALNVPLAELNAPARRMAMLNAIVGIVALVIGLVISLFTARAIAKPLTTVAAQLTANSEQTAAAAQQVSSASNQLATGATQQAASLEESSSSLEELSSMTQHNSDHARQANTLAREARTAAESGAGDMTQLGTAMEGIKSSSDDIKKIVKTIDEIAFQTNILALNAAVEAARAGEAGAGFAVVADEVRNLAQRSAKAAKETADMVEGAIAKTELGATLSSKVGLSLQEIVTKIRRVDELVAEVASASGEQSQGVKQINTAVSEMDKLTQGNAATAEESASAAHELSAQAESLKLAVGDLIALVEGTRSTPPPAHTAAIHSHATPATTAPAHHVAAPAKRPAAVRPQPSQASSDKDKFFT